MKIIKAHYDKLLLFAVIFIIAISLILSFFENFDINSEVTSRSSPSFTLSSYEGEQAIELLRQSDLMPDDILKFHNKLSGEVIKSSVSKVVFSRKSRVEVYLNNNKSLKGRLLNPTETIISENWKKVRTPLPIDTESGVVNLNMRDITKIKGNQKVILVEKIDDMDEIDYSIDTYQNKSNFLTDSNRTEKIRWTNNSSDFNSSIYDLFTPPIIYLVDGELTTSLPEKPEKEVKEEEFGLRLVAFEKEKFRLKLSSWIGQTPYFEDLETKVSPNSNANVKNRIEVKVPYKINPNYRPGLPSLIKTSEDDEDKFFIVEYFTVQDVKDSKTGGSKPVGRALVKDFNSDGNPFEINSRMDEVFTDKFKIHLSFQLEGELPNDIHINDKDAGKSFEFGSRIFEIIEIDLNSKSVEVSKQVVGRDLKQTRTLSL